jgi:phenylacetate-coenzyme A ligase PaaK-like adenylate-forming protein
MKKSQTPEQKKVEEVANQLNHLIENIIANRSRQDVHYQIIQKLDEFKQFIEEDLELEEARKEDSQKHFTVQTVEAEYATIILTRMKNKFEEMFEL